MTDGEFRLVSSAAFDAYRERLRETWPENPELAKKHGVAAGNGQSFDIDMSESQTGEAEAQTTNMGRRAFCVTAGATLALATTGASMAAAATDLNYSSDYVHNPTLEGTVEIAEHDRTKFDSEIEYINDSGDPDSFESAGGAIAENDDDSTAHNPVSLRPDKIATEEYYGFPRGESYDSDGDGEDDSDVYVLDATHWSTDVSGTAGSLTFEDTESAAETTALHVAASGQASGDVAKATFSNFETINSGIDRKRLQLVATVDSLPSGTTVYVRVRDSAGNVKEAWMDADADSTATGTITTQTGPGQVYQMPLGELSTALDDIDEIEIAIADGDADITIAGLNLEKESEWVFGTEQYVNSDDELKTRTLKEPSGSYSITKLDTLGDEFSSATIRDLQVEVEFAASRLGDDGSGDSEWSDGSDWDQDERLEHMEGWDLPTAYDISYATDLTLRDETLFADHRYLEAGFATGLDELPSLEDKDDISWTDATATYEGGNIGDEITLSASIAGGQKIAWHVDVVMSESERESATATGGVGGGAVSSSGGWFSGPRGILTSAAATILGYLAYSANMIPGVGGE